MKSRYKLIIKGIALLGIVGQLTSCGGGSNGPPPTPTTGSITIIGEVPE